ncbi:glycosyltransferase [Adhaeribacter swui]|uniref:Glycosyltransferase n=1 Tax=Adhaeribacter swui TaxID=2086471 RepID=A0A7G7GEB5_9BACT|nr:glycosyltransferase family 4 protein [Adhaeribacter swui]QNF35499.1 glycosyltransferase [Adhaeribacter swui]
MKTLHLCNRVPFPPHDGGAIGIYDIVSNLAAQGADVTVLAINTPKHFQPDDVLQERARLITVFVNTNISVVKAFFNLFTTIPYIFERFVSPAYTSRLIQLLQTETFDIIQVEGSQMAWYVPTIRQYSKAPIVLRAHNVEYTIWQRLARHEQNFLKKIYLHYTAREVRRFEKTYFQQFDAIAAITPDDKKRIEELGVTTQIEVIPAGVEMSRFARKPADAPQDKTLFMIGSLNWLPNQEGITWFLDNVWSVISQEDPELELHIAGSSPPPHMLALQIPRVTIHGFVPDAAAFMQQYELMLVPLLSGGGMRIKIVEGMGFGKCILTTPVGAEGIQVTPDHNILIAETAAEWLQVLRNYLAGKLPIQNIAQNAAHLIQQQYDNKIVITKYLKLYNSMASSKI